jgi:glycerol-3-phosphate acyltransferase PlsY
VIPQFLLLIVGAYLIGSIPTAYLVAKWTKGIDIRRFGSGNVGLSNVVASGSRWSSVIVVAIDFLKGMAPVLVARGVDLHLYQQIVIGLAAICGHNWTVFLHFSGGRGILTTLGVIFALAPWLAMAMLAVALAFLPFKQFAVGTLIALLLLPICSWFLSGVLGIDRSLTLTLGFVGIMVLAIVRRLTAPRTEFWGAFSLSEILVWRLLFDRDIKDRARWLSRARSGTTSAN